MSDVTLPPFDEWSEGPNDGSQSLSQAGLYRAGLDIRVRKIARIRYGCFMLSYKPDRVDLFVRTDDPRKADIVVHSMCDMRGLRSVMSGRNVYRKAPYAYMQTHYGDWYCCALAAGDYDIIEEDDGQLLIWYDDAGVKPVDKALYEPEYTHLIQPPKKRIERKPLRLPKLPIPEPPTEPEIQTSPAMKIQRKPLKVSRLPPRARRS